jgi:hypothetical protein
MINMTENQKRLVSNIAWTYICGEDYAYIETGQCKHFRVNTVTSVISKGIASKHPTLEPRCYTSDIYYLVPSGDVCEMLDELREWQYGDLFSYFDTNEIKYNPDHDLINLRHQAFEHKIGRK